MLLNKTKTSDPATVASPFKTRAKMMSNLCSQTLFSLWIVEESILNKKDEPNARMQKLFTALVGSLLATVTANCSLLFSDSFDYQDGPLTSVSAGVWVNHSGTLGQVDVTGGRVNLTGAESEDVHANLLGGPYSSSVLYYSMLVNFSALPQGAGTYFTHLMDNTTVFRARVIATTNGASLGSLRLAISNGSNPPNYVQYPQDLSLGIDYLIVVRYDIDRVASRLWVNPTTETSPSVDATDDVTGTQIYAIALRQSRTTGPTDMGTLSVDNVKVATSFVEVVPEPISLLPIGLLGLVITFALQQKRNPF